jgi:hypothetical protein
MKGPHVGWWCLLGLNALFLITAWTWQSTIPFNRAPDEFEHFHFNVEIILNQHRLPVSGVDDLDAYAALTSRSWGRVVSRYSYCVYPAFNYLVSAATAAIARDGWDWPAWRGARLASLAWGLIYLNALCLALRRVTGGRWGAALAATAAAALLPQVVFLASYTNADIHSLAASALLALALLNVWPQPERSALWWLGLATGLVLVAKYNYFILLPATPLLLVTLARRDHWTARQLASALGQVTLVAGLFSGGWFIRNLVLYHDPLGQGFALRLMQRYAEPQAPLPFTWSNLWLLVQLNFHGQTFESLLGRFDYMTLRMPGLAYRVAEIVLGAVGLGGLLVLFLRRDQTARRWLVALGALVTISLALHVYNSMVNDFQPQGRYLFPVLVPCALYGGWVASRHPALLRGLTLVVLLILGLLLIAHLTISGAYPAGITSS